MGRWLLLPFFAFSLWFLIKKFPPQGGISLQIANTKIGLYQIKLKDGTLKVGSLVVNVNPKEPAVNLEQPLDLKPVKDSISILEKLLYLFPFRVEIKDTYISVGKVSVNIYDLSIEEGGIKLRLGEIFTGSPHAYILENVTLSAKGNGLTLKGKIYQPHLEFKALLNTSVWRGELYLATRSGYRLKGNFSLLREKATLEATLKGNRLWAQTFLAFYYPTLRGTFEGLAFDVKTSGEFSLNIEDLIGKLKGKLNLCGEKFLYSADLFPEGLFVSLENLQNLAYLHFGLKGKRFFSFGSVGDGILSLLYKNGTLKLKVGNLSLNDLCGVRLKGLTAQGLLSENKFHLKGGFKGFSFRAFTIGKEKLLLRGQDGNILLRLGGSVKGLILKRKRFLWGYLSGEADIGGKPFKFNLPSLDAYLDEDKKLFLWTRFLSYNNFYIEEVKASLSYRKGSFKAKLEGGVNGKVSYKSGKYIVNLKGWVFKDLKPFKVGIFAGGSTRQGKGKLTFDSFKVSFSYLQKGDGLSLDFKAFWKFLGVFGKLHMSSKTFNLNVSGNLTQNPLGITGIFSASAGGKRDLSNFWLRFFPFCLNFLGDKLACFSEISLSKKRTLRAVVKTYEGFPLHLTSEVELEKENLRIYTRLKLSTAVVNRLLSEINTYIVEPSSLETVFAYRGTVKDFLKKANWNYSTTLKVLSSYAYKPLRLYLTLALEKGGLNGFLGISDYYLQSVYGNLSLNANLLSGKVMVNTDLEDFPLRIYLPEFLTGYLKISFRGKVEKSDLWKIKTLLSIGGFVKVLSYKNPAGEGDQGSPPQKVDFDIELTTGEPLYVETPNGKVVLSLKGRFTNLERNLLVRINYGKLLMLGKTFYIGGGKVTLKNNKVSLNLPLTSYLPDKTVYLRIYGSLPWENLSFDIYSVPPTPKNRLLAELLSGGGGKSLVESPLTKVLLQSGAQAVAGALEKFSSSLIKGITVRFSPSFDPQIGFAMGIDIEKDLGDFAKIGYHWFPSSNPKNTYLWGAVKLFGSSFLRLEEYSDGSYSLALRFAKEFGFPF